MSDVTLQLYLLSIHHYFFREQFCHSADKLNKQYYSTALLYT